MAHMNACTTLSQILVVAGAALVLGGSLEDASDVSLLQHQLEVEEAASACPEPIFGYINPETTTVTDASTSGALMAQLFSNPELDVSPRPLVMLHYMPGFSEKAIANRQAVFGAGVQPSGCLAPGAPKGCGFYRVTEYDGCEFPKDAGDSLIYGGLDLAATYTDAEGTILGCEDKVKNVEYVCYLRSGGTPLAPGPPEKVDCNTACSSGYRPADFPAPPAALQLPQSACPEPIFGYINPETTAVTDASTSGALMAQLFSNPELNVSPRPLVMLHYMPGFSASTIGLREAVFGKGVQPPGLGCLAPGAPKGCGWYRVTEYDGCEFPKDAGDLVYGGLDLAATYTDAKGTILGCEDKVKSFKYVCYLRSGGTALAPGPPTLVDCATTCSSEGAYRPVDA